MLRSRALPLLMLLLLALIAGATACAGESVAVAPTGARTSTAEAATATPEPTETEVPPTDTPTPTNSATPAERSDTADTDPPTLTPRPTDTPAPTATATVVPSATPTSRPQFAPTLAVQEPVLREGAGTPATAIPTAVAPFSMPSGTTNLLLLGSDAPVGDRGVKRTDTMIVVSVNRDGPTASMLSLPRDLYVYVPGKDMHRLNAAITLGGVELLKQTILYNFGIPIHYYARVDFDGFEGIVDAMGGVEVPVSCRFEDWRLISPDLDPELEENWEQFALEPGIYNMDGDTALWYARSRLSSNDFDRGRRQQQLLRGMLNTGVDLGLMTQVPALYESFNEAVDTDLDVGRILQLASLAPGIRENGVQNLYVFGKTQPWTVPVEDAQVQLPIWEGQGMMGETVQRLFLPPALNKASRAPIVVEVVNASGNPDMAQLAAENLAWYGFVPVIENESVPHQDDTELRYYAPNFKGSFDWLISWVVGLDGADILLVDDDPFFPYDYQVVLGEDYDPCVNEFFAPQSFLP